MAAMTNQRVRPATVLRIYESPQGPRVYFTVENLEAASLSDVGIRWGRKALHVEAVHKSGRARVLKCASGPTGYIATTSETEYQTPRKGGR